MISSLCAVIAIMAMPISAVQPMHNEENPMQGNAKQSKAASSTAPSDGVRKANTQKSQGDDHGVDHAAVRRVGVQVTARGNANVALTSVTTAESSNLQGEAAVSTTLSGTYMIKSTFDNRCLIFSGNGGSTYPERYDWGHGGSHCGFPSQNSNSQKDSLVANKQGAWSIESLGGTLYMIKSTFDNRCLIFSGNGGNAHPSRHDWGHGGAYCGFPSQNGNTQKDSLIANKQGVWSIESLGGTAYMIKSTFDNKCLIFSGNGGDKHPSRHNWNSGDYCGFPSQGGNSNKDSLIANKQAVWSIEVLQAPAQ